MTDAQLETHAAVPPAVAAGPRVPLSARIFDAVVILALAPVLVPLGLLIALAIVIDSPGPVLYRAKRVGRGGQTFEMFKFRTMLEDAQGLPLRVRGDGRQTPLGHRLTATRLDELPQLINVLRGQMRLVGPRPEVREFVDEYPDAYAEILSVPPGLTGSTQLAFAHEGAVLAAVRDHERRRHYVEHLLPAKIELDLAYVRSRSLLRDVAILVRTFLLPATGPVAQAARRRNWGAVHRRVALTSVTAAMAALYVIVVVAPG